MGATGHDLKKNREYFELTGVESFLFADSTNAYRDLPFKQLKPDLCANAVIYGR